MAYKYESILKTFEYSKDSYKVISDFLLSGDITNPNVMLNVTKVSKEFGKRPNDWFANPSVLEFIKALLQVKIESNDKKLIKTFCKFLKDEKTITRKSCNGKNNGLIDKLNSLKQKELMSFLRKIGMLITKKGGNNKELTGTWVNRDLAVKYAEWLDPKFSIWVSQKILDLVSDGVAWNKIRLQTRIDYKPLTDAIEKHIRPKYPKMQENILFG